MHLTPALRDVYAIPGEMQLISANMQNGEDRTAIELFIAGVRGWEADLRRRLHEGKSRPE